jgi:hypothetical protein
MEQFMNFVKESHANITVSQDKNLELDPYFYERQKELHQIRADVKSGKIEILLVKLYTSIRPLPRTLRLPRQRGHGLNTR